MNVFDRLRKTTAELNVVQNIASDALKQVEQELIQSGVGVTATVSICGNKELIFSKFENKGFRLLVGNNESAIPWQESSREHKILSASKLGELIGMIQKEIDRLVELTQSKEFKELMKWVNGSSE